MAKKKKSNAVEKEDTDKKVEYHIEKEITAENIDDSQPVYNNCLFYQIDTAFVGDPRLIPGNAKMKQVGNISEQEVEELKKQMVDYIANVTTFSPEIVERVLFQAEEFIKRQTGGLNS